MKQPVVVKANNFGLLVILDSELEFEALCKAVGDKFRESANFFGNSDMAVGFEGRRLSEEEEGRLISAITENTSLNIICTVDNDPVREERFKRRLEAISNSQDLSMAKIHKGNFRSGQMMEFDTGVIIIGDINPGAKVIAKGNIIIFGALKGEAEAGSGGNDDTFIIALDMKPIQLRIGSLIARSSDSSLTEKRAKDTVPQVAFVENESIYIENLDKNIFDSLKI